MKDSFLLYYDQKEIWELLSPEQCKELIVAIYNFQQNKNPDLSPVVRIASVSIFKQMLRDASKWELIKEKRARAGRIGGLVSSKQANASSGNSSKSSKRVANQAVTVTVTDTVINKKKEKKETLSQTTKEEAGIVLEYFNMARGTTYRSYNEWVGNFQKYRQNYSVDDIKQAIKNTYKFKWWNDVVTPTILFRTKNRGGEVDNIGQLLNGKPDRALSDYQLDLMRIK